MNNVFASKCKRLRTPIPCSSASLLDMLRRSWSVRGRNGSARRLCWPHLRWTGDTENWLVRKKLINSIFQFCSSDKLYFLSKICILKIWLTCFTFSYGFLNPSSPIIGRFLAHGHACTMRTKKLSWTDSLPLFIAATTTWNVFRTLFIPLRT